MVPEPKHVIPPDIVVPMIKNGYLWNKLGMMEKVANFMRSLRIFPFSFPPILSFSHFPLISDAWSATYYVDATNGNDSNAGLPEASPWKTIAKVNTSRLKS